MKYRHILFKALPALLLVIVHDIAAQGSLTPPGAPVPAMKTLEQVEQRIPISSIPITISKPGSYYLTTNLTAGAGQNGITVSANDVTIDLNGFTMTGSGTNSGHGVYQPNSYRNLRVMNGKFANWKGGSSAAVYMQGRNGWVDAAQVSDNHFGVYTRISLGARITNCSISGSVSFGIYGGTGSFIENCTAFENNTTAIYAFDRSMIIGCTVCENGTGVSAGNYVTVRNCVVKNNAGSNIQVHTACVVDHNLSIGSGGSGIVAYADQCRIDSNMVMNNLIGINADGTNNLVICNSAGNNTINYEIAAGNKVGKIVNPDNCSAISGDSGGGLGNLAGFRQWANFVTDTNVQ